MPIFRGQKRQWFLSILFKEPFPPELLLELIESQLQRTEADRLHVLHDHLIVPARLVHGEPAADHNFQAVFRAKFQIAVVAPKAGRLELRPLVFKREVHVSGRVMFEIRDFTLDPDQAETLQRTFDLRGDFEYSEDFPFRE